MKNLDRFVRYQQNINAEIGTSSYIIIDYNLLGMTNSDSYRKDLNSLLRINSNNWTLQKIQLNKAQEVLKLLKQVKVQ